MENERQDPDVTYRLNQLYVYATDSCNLRCRHCWIEPHSPGRAQPRQGIEPDLFGSILNQAVPLGLAGVKLTGGEPLLHPAFTRLLDTIRAKDLGLSLETNAVLCTQDLAKRLVDFPRRFVSVSLDSPDAPTHDWIRGTEGSFRLAVRGIEHLVSAGVRPQIIMTVMRRNRDHLANLVGLAERIGAESVKFNILQPTARAETLHRQGEALPLADLITLGRWVETDLSRQTSLPLTFHQPPAFLGLGRMFGPAGDGCHTCGILGILGVLADGSYALCGIGATVPEMVFGHAAHDSLRDVWLGHPTLLSLREGLPHRLSGVCARCFFKRICLGSCIAQNYYRARDLWAPFWYCEEAHRHGLFPESRLPPEGNGEGTEAAPVSCCTHPSGLHASPLPDR